MLEWEPNIARDIGPIFMSAAELASTPQGTSFVDLTDRNKDMRVITLEGAPVLLYSFFDNKYLIITDRLETMRTLIERLTREKLSR